MSELYEELPGDQVEEFYEDLPGSAYDGYPDPSSPPPLPSTLPPSSRPGRAAQPPLPQWAPTTTLSTAKTLPPPRKKEKETSKKPGTLKPSISGGISGGGGGGGIDMNEILKKARMRNQSAFEDLESKRTREEEGEDKHAAPWLNQLRKSAPAPKLPPKLRPEEDEAEVPPWVKRRTASEKPLPQEVTENGQEEKVPEFVRKARSMSFRDDDDDHSHSTKPPPPPVKPRLASPPLTRPKPVDQPEISDKPAWLKQRERQLNMSKLTHESIDGSDLPQKPSNRPNSSTTVLPRSESPGQHQRSESPGQHPPPPAKRAKPVPVPRIAPKPADLPQPSQEMQREEEGSRVYKEEESPPLTPSSVRERAKTLERGLGGGGSATPPPVLSRHQQEPPKPKPKAFPRSPSHQNVSPVPVGSTEKPPPPVPIRRESTEPQLPAVPTWDHSVPPIVSPPPPLVPPRARESPPVVHREPPATTPHLLSKPPLPLLKPPLRGPISQGEPTPPMVTVQKFRRRPLQSVDPYNPPPVPLRRTKPVLPTGSGPLSEELETEEIYDDTVIPPTPHANGVLEDEDDVYDDVTVATQQPLPPQNPPPPSRPPPSSSQLEDSAPPPVPSLPPPSKRPAPPLEDSAPPPVPSLPPPSKRPAPAPIPTEDELLHYEMEDAPQNGIEISAIDEEQETYEDMNLEDLPTSLSSQALSSSSLVPPSPNNPGASPSESPTLSRKQLTKDERRQQKEDERREKEREKERKRQEKERERQEKEKERERKKKEEAHSKNRQKGLKAYKQFGLPNDVQSLFAVEMLVEHPKLKDHLSVTEGEVAFVLLLNHPKLPDGRYLVEKQDGTIGYVRKDISQRTAYSVKSVPQITAPAGNYPDPEDIYESLPDGAPQEEFSPVLPTTLPPPNLPAGHPASTGGTRFPPPSQPPPPPPSAAVDGPEENYEYLPDVNESG